MTNEKEEYVTQKEFDELKKQFELSLSYNLDMLKRINNLQNCVKTLQDFTIGYLKDHYEGMATEKENNEGSDIYGTEET